MNNAQELKAHLEDSNKARMYEEKKKQDEHKKKEDEMIRVWNDEIAMKKGEGK